MSVIDKKMIAQSFGSAAPTYDSAAHFQRWTGEQLLNKIPQSYPGVVLDLGCGTGFFASHLQKKFPESAYIGMDLSEGMAAFAKSNHSESCRWLAGDAESLPFYDQSVDLIFSSLAIQWCSNLPLLMSEVKRVLKPNGCFVFSTLLDGSLSELKAAWSVIDSRQHVNDFFSEEEYRAALAQTGLKTLVLQEESKILEYQKVTELMRELKKLGAHNLNASRSTALMGKEKLNALVAEYETFRVDQSYLPASYQILWGVVSKG